MYGLLKEQCAYSLITEHRTISGENTVLPYAISCLELDKNLYKKGETFSFNMFIAGKAVSYLPYIVYGLKQWDKLDMGWFQPFVTNQEINNHGPYYKWPAKVRPRGKLGLVTVEQIFENGKKSIYTPDGLLTKPDVKTLSLESGSLEGSWRVCINFMSPVRIFRKVYSANAKRKKDLISSETFNSKLFFHSILTRFSGLYIHFCDGSEDFGPLTVEKNKKNIEMVKMGKNHLEFEKLRRYKRDMTRWVHMDGLKGKVEFKNVPGALIPWIRAGEIFHMGKFPTMGFGEYKVEYL